MKHGTSKIRPVQLSNQLSILFSTKSHTPEKPENTDTLKGSSLSMGITAKEQRVTTDFKSQETNCISEIA